MHSRNSGGVPPIPPSIIIIVSSQLPPTMTHPKITKFSLPTSLLISIVRTKHISIFLAMLKKELKKIDKWEKKRGFWLWPQGKTLPTTTTTTNIDDDVNDDRTPVKKKKRHTCFSVNKKNSRCLPWWCFSHGGGWVLCWILAWTRGSGGVIRGRNLCNGNGGWGTGRSGGGMGVGSDSGGLCKIGIEPEIVRMTRSVPTEVREDIRSVSVEEVRVWSCELSPSRVVVAQIGILRIVHDDDKIRRDGERDRERKKRS